jgi:protein-tyrosine phosphatase
MFDNVLIVCVGNICRSPTAEKILQAEAPGLNISSAGIDALVGKPINSNAGHQLTVNGYKDQNHSARQLNQKLVQEADLVLVMEEFQRRRLMRDYPSESGKVMLLGKWLDNLEINDPYRKSAEAFALVFEQIEQSCQAWAKKLC